MMEYFFELFESLPRQGPGNNKLTEKAFQYLKNIPSAPKILDIGCGRGMQTIALAKLSNGTVTALDNHQPFLDMLTRDAKKEGVEHRIICTNQSMLKMNFDEMSFDIIWSEGALYHLGFEKGLDKLYNLLKKDGYLVFSEAVLFKEDLPDEVWDFWKDEYPDIGNIDKNLDLINENNFQIIAHFTLPKTSWFIHFYNPMKKEIKRLKEKYIGNTEALEFFNVSEHEIFVYDKYSDYFGYEFFIMKK
jgi:ubiquinone/menaquinone biosynthesis C-methylase UbiE